MKSLPLMFALFVSVAAAQLPAKSVERFTGKLDTRLSPDFVHIYQRILSSRPTKLKFDPAIDPKAIVSNGEISNPLSETGKTELILVEPPTGETLIAMDVNANGVIEDSERIPLRPSPQNANDLLAIVGLPIKTPLFKSYPIFIQYKRGFKHPKLADTDRLILQTVIALAYGRVDIRGRTVMFQYPFSLESPWIDTRDGLFGVDVDGDGRIRDEQFSIETSQANDDEVVFRMGDVYLSTESIDLAKNVITVRTRAKEEYQRQELEVGKVMPDFTFVDFEGKTRSLYEFKGKYLLVDFWGAWCTDCRVETPYHVEAMKRFRARGFEILSINTDEQIGTAKGYMAENNMTWTQARNDSIRKLVEVTYRIQEYPSTILLGPDAKVLVLDQRSLRGEKLMETLEGKLPK